MIFETDRCFFGLPSSGLHDIVKGLDLSYPNCLHSLHALSCHYHYPILCLITSSDLPSWLSSLFYGNFLSLLCFLLLNDLLLYFTASLFFAFTVNIIDLTLSDWLFWSHLNLGQSTQSLLDPGLGVLGFSMIPRGTGVVSAVATISPYLALFRLVLLHYTDQPLSNKTHTSSWGGPLWWGC